MRAAIFLSFTSAIAAQFVKIASFDGSKLQHKWVEENDPVMGGASTNCTFTEEHDQLEFGHFIGEVKIIPSLKVPGFCFARTAYTSSADYPDLSSYEFLQIVVRNHGPMTKFHMAFAADTLVPQFKSFKADVNISVSEDWQTVAVPFSAFSNDWDPANGEPKKHVPPTAKNLKDVSQLQFWAEGTAGHFELDMLEWRASKTAGADCPDTTYCCPDAKHCLTPTPVSCAKDASVCKDPQVCCPITKLCVEVGDVCTPQCADPAAYCCPDALHCLTPTNPGVLCKKDSECANGGVCCPITHECVSVGLPCAP